MKPGNARFRLAVYAALTMLTVTLAWALANVANHLAAYA